MDFFKDETENIENKKSMQNNHGGGPDFINGEGGHNAHQEHEVPYLWPGSKACLRALEALGFRCSLVLSEPCFEAF